MRHHLDPEDFFDGLENQPGFVSSHERQEAYRLLEEMAKRRVEALKLYEPLPFQERFHACTAKECMLMAGNQVGKAGPYNAPVLTPTGWTELGKLKVGDTVVDGLGNPTKVTGVYPQGIKKMLKFTFDDRTETTFCEDHLWKCKQTKRERFRGGDWSVKTGKEILEYGGNNPKPIKRAVIPTAVCQLEKQEVPLDSYLLGCLIGDGSISGGGVQITSADQEIIDRLVLPDGHVAKNLKSHKYAYSLTNSKPTYGTVNNSDRRCNNILQSLKKMGLWGKRSEYKFIPKEYLLNDVKTRLDLLRGLMDTDGHCGINGTAEYCTTSEQLAEDFVSLVQSLGGKCKVTWRVTHYIKDGKRIYGLPSARIRVRMWYANPFKLKRKADRWIRPTSTTDGRVIHKIEETGERDCLCITVDSPDKTFITNDFIVTHNSLAGFIEDARAVTGQDPHNKYPKENGILACVGMDEGHIGRVMFRYLFQPGAFYIIRDEKTDEWRSYKPWEKSDLKRKDERKPAPPLIPERFIKSIAWKSRGKKVFDHVELHNGWIIRAFSSKGSPAAGFQADLIHFDEDVEDPNWYDEMIARLSMRAGKMRISSLPYIKNDALMNVYERAEEEAETSENPSTVVIKATIFDNPFMDDQTKQENIKRWKAKGEQEYRMRALGEMTMDEVLMYPSFSLDVHDAVKKISQVDKTRELDGFYYRSEVQKIYTENACQPPHNWTRYAWVDPGTSVCAVIFLAVPPPELGDHIVAYDELYIRGCNAYKFAEHFERKTRDQRFEAFGIDAHGGRIRDIGSGLLPREQYSSELARRKIRSDSTGSNFIDGVDIPEAREECLHNALRIREDGTPRLYVDFEKCPSLVWEMKRFKRLRDPKTQMITDKGRRGPTTHLVETLEYGVAHGAPYVKPKRTAKKNSIVDRIMSDIKMRAEQRRITKGGSSRNHITLGPKGSDS